MALVVAQPKKQMAVMAYKPTYKKRYAPVSRYVRRFKKRYYSNKGKGYKPTVMPLKYKFTSRYVEYNTTLTWSASAGTGNTVFYAYSANGLYDPNISGTGHQPVGYDQLMAFYDHYTVIGSKIRFRIQNESDQHPCIVALQVVDDVSPAAPQQKMDTIIENGACKWRRLERQGSDGSFINNMYSTTNLSQKVNIKKFLGRPNILSEDDLRGTITSNPDEQVFYKLALLGGIDGSIDAITINFTVQIDYVAILTEPKLIAGS